MTRTTRLVLGLFTAIAFLVLFGPAVTAAQNAPAQVPPARAVPRQAAPRQAAPAARAPLPVRTVTEAQNAEDTRRELDETLRRYSPAVAGVLKLDPTLLSNPDYLAPYPGLADFLAQHPEIARDPAYFFDGIDTGLRSRPEPYDPRHEAIAMWRSMLEGIAVFTVFFIVATTVAWLVKTLIDSRRWWRLSKVQADVHNKILDRFATSEELLAYVQTPAGRRFLESAPIALDPAGPTMSAPVRRILWSIEAGFVLIAGGAGLQFVSGRIPPEVAPVLFALGVLAMALGIGFIVAAVVSFLISKRLGLVPAAPAPGPAA